MHLILKGDKQITGLVRGVSTKENGYVPEKCNMVRGWQLLMGSEANQLA
jgi:hypothetical protein